MKLVPLGDRVVLKQLVAEETTKSGIVLPGQEKEKPQQAEVIENGSSDRRSGHLFQVFRYRSETGR
jgi:co-chaperonin GroES (HSP10)